MKLSVLPLSLLALIHYTLSSEPAPPISTGIVLRANVAIHTSGSCDPTSGLTIRWNSVPPGTCIFSSTDIAHNAAMSVTGTIFGYAGANNYVSGFRWPNCWQEVLRYSYPHNPHCLEIPNDYRAVSYNWTFAGYDDFEDYKQSYLNGETPKKWPDSFGRPMATNWRRDGPFLERRDRIPFDDFDDAPVMDWKPAPGCIGPNYIEYYDVDAGKTRKIDVGHLRPVPLTEFVKKLLRLFEKKSWKELGAHALDNDL